MGVRVRPGPRARRPGGPEGWPPSELNRRPLASAPRRPRLPKVNIRSVVAPTLSRYPTEYQWQELEELLRQALSTMPRQTLPEALAEEPARTVLDEWRHRHWLDESAALLP